MSLSKRYYWNGNILLHHFSFNLVVTVKILWNVSIHFIVLSAKCMIECTNSSFLERVFVWVCVCVFMCLCSFINPFNFFSLILRIVHDCIDFSIHTNLSLFGNIGLIGTYFILLFMIIQYMIWICLNLQVWIIHLEYNSKECTPIERIKKLFVSLPNGISIRIN